MSLHFRRDDARTCNADEVRFLTDALLSLYRERSEPDLTEPALKRLPQRDALQIRKLAKWVSGDRDPFLAAEITRAVAAAQLRPRQQAVFELRMRGFTFDQIGRHVMASTASVARSFVRALARIRQARERDPYAGLGEVYRAETRRRR